MERVRSSVPTLLGDLRSNRSFLRLLGGRLVTNAGDSLYYIAAMWLVFDLTGSPLYTGIAGFLVRAPSALSFLTGPLVDRWSLRRVLVGTQAVNGLLVLAVPAAAWTGHLSVWVVLGVLPLVTFVNQFVYPAQNAALPRMVEETNLARANSLLSAAYQGADMVFNAASGVLIAVVGAVTLFVADSITFGLALVLFAGLSVGAVGDADGEAGTASSDGAESTGGDEADPAADRGAGSAADPETDPDAEGEAASSGDREPSGGTGRAGADGRAGYLADLREGLAYVRGSLLVALLAGVVVTNFTAGAALGVLPAFAATVGGPDAFGLLMAAYAGGSLTGTLLASRVDDRPLGRFVVVGNAGSGLLLAAALALSWFPATVGLFYLTFVPVGAFNVLFFTTLQSAVADDLLGRVSSVVTSAASVAIPVGSAVGGAAAGALGSRFVLSWWAVGTLSFGLYVAVRPTLRSLPAAPDIDAATLRLGDGGGPPDRADGRPPAGSAGTPGANN